MSTEYHKIQSDRLSWTNATCSWNKKDKLVENISIKRWLVIFQLSRNILYFLKEDLFSNSSLKIIALLLD